MSRGVALSPKTKDLNLIFFKVRESRTTSARRSWMRRARLALAERTDLTPAGQHEVLCVWIQPNSHLIDSPAMSKIRGIKHEPQPQQTIKAERFTRRNFYVKKPAYSGLSAANDERFIFDCGKASRTHQIERAGHQHQSNYSYRAAIAPIASLQSQGYIFQRFHRDSDGLSLPDSGIHVYRHYQHGQAQKLIQKTQSQKLILSFFTPFLSHELGHIITKKTTQKATRLGLESRYCAPFDAKNSLNIGISRTSKIWQFMAVIENFEYI